SPLPKEPLHMTVDPTVLRSESFAEVGLLIKRDATLITERWSQRAAQEQPMAQRVHHQALLDHIPQLLDQIGNTLAESGNGHVAFHRGPASRHGEQRWDAGWSLTEVIRDYQILRLVLVDYLESTLDRLLRTPLPPCRTALHVLGLDHRPETVAWARGLMGRQVKLLTRLVDDLLDVSRIARGKITLRHERMDLVRLVRETAEDRRGSLAEA